MSQNNWWADSLFGENLEKESNDNLKRTVSKRANDADYFLDILINQNIIKLEKEKVKDYFIKWFLENKEFDLEIVNGDLALEDGDFKIVPNFDKKDIVEFIKWFRKNEEEFLIYLEKNGINLTDKMTKNSTTVKNSKNVTINNGIIKNKESDKKSKTTFVISVITVVIVILTFLFGNNIYLNYFSSNEKEVKEEVIKKIEVKKNEIIDVFELANSNEKTILDETIYLKYSYNNLIIGGINLDSIKINARTINGEKLNLNQISNYIELDITEQPFIELKYKNELYSIKVLGKHYSFNVTIKKHVNSTMKLYDYNEI